MNERLNNDWTLPCSPEEFDREWLLHTPKELIQINEMDPYERRFLSGMVRMSRPKKLLEIGVSGGGASGIILNAISDMPGAHLTSVDMMDKWYRDNTKKVGWAVYEYCKEHLGRWTLITGKDPVEAIEEQIGGDIDFCCIDTAHIHPIETLNFLSVLPFLKEGTVVVMRGISLFMYPTPKNENHSTVQQNARRYKSYGATMLFNTVVSDKLFPKNNDTIPSAFPNIGAFRITPDTRKYVTSLFFSLSLEWKTNLSPELIEKFRTFFNKYYGVECLNMFDKAVQSQMHMLKLDQEKSTHDTAPSVQEQQPPEAIPPVTQKPKGVLVIPAVEHKNFLDWCKEYNPNEDSMLITPPVSSDAPTPEFTVKYKNCLQDKITFDIKKLHPNARNPMRLIWELSSDDAVICEGDEDACIPHTVKIDVPPEHVDLKLTVRLTYDISIPVGFCSILLTGFSYHETVVIEQTRLEDKTENNLQIPPKELMDFNVIESAYILSGKNDYIRMSAFLENNGISLNDNCKVLEFGCSTCRILRHFPETASIWGADFRDKKMQWAMRQFPSRKLIQCGNIPPLPFADGYFGFVYAVNQFTKLKETHTAWLSELARVTRPGGYAYLTFYDEQSAQRILDGFAGKIDMYFKEFDYLTLNAHARKKLEKFDFDSLSAADIDSKNMHIFMSRNYIENAVSEFFELVETLPRAVSDVQTAYLFKRRQSL